MLRSYPRVVVDSIIVVLYTVAYLWDGYIYLLKIEIILL